MIKVLDKSHDDILAVEAFDKLTHEDYEQVWVPALDKLINEYGEVEKAFNAQVTPLLNKGNLEKPTGNKKPNSFISSVKQIQRDPAVKAWVIRNSKGVCEACRTKAPFHTKDGRFYLEVHHVKQLGLLGSDRIENAVALCPNCHREIHCGMNREKIEQKLYQNIPRLKKENID